MKDNLIKKLAWIISIILGILFSISAMYKATFYRIITKKFLTFRVMYLPLIYIILMVIVIIICYRVKRTKKVVFRYIALVISIVYIMAFDLLIYLPDRIDNPDFTARPDLEQTNLIEGIHQEKDSNFYITWNEGVDIDLSKCKFQLSVYPDEELDNVITKSINRNQIDYGKNKKGKLKKTCINTYKLLPKVKYYSQYHIFVTLLYGNKAETERVADYNNIGLLNNFFYRGEFAEEYYSFISYRVLSVLFFLCICALELLYSNYLQKLIGNTMDID